MTTFYNPFTIQTLEDGWKSLSVKTRDLIQHPSVRSLLERKFGPFTVFNSIPKSVLFFCHQDRKLNLYQISSIHDLFTIHILRMYDETRLQSDIDNIVSYYRSKAYGLQSHITLKMYLYVPYNLSIDALTLMSVFRAEGIKETDIHGNVLYTKIKLYTCKWRLSHTLADIKSHNTSTHRPSEPEVKPVPPPPQPLFTAPAPAPVSTPPAPTPTPAPTPVFTPPPVFGAPQTQNPTIGFTTPPVFGAPTTAAPVFGATPAPAPSATPCFANTTFSFGTTKK
jgi:hypothetical protein